MKKRLRFFCVLALLLGMTVSLPVFAAQPGARILLESYEIVEGEAAAGEQVTLRFTFQNVSPSASAAGVLITYGTGNSGIVPVYGSSNQIYIPSLSAGERYVQEVPCRVLNQQNNSTVQMYFSASYRDDVAGGGSNDFMISIPLENPVRLEIQNLTLPAEFWVQNQGAGHLTVVNSGESDAYKVVLHCEGAIPQAQKTIALGEIAGGESMGIDFSLTFLEEGEQDLLLWLEYEDKNDVSSQTEMVEASAAVQPAVSTEHLPETGNENDTIQIPWVMVAVVVLVMIFLLGVWIYYKTAKKTSLWTEEGDENGK